MGVAAVILIQPSSSVAQQSNLYFSEGAQAALGINARYDIVMLLVTL